MPFKLDVTLQEALESVQIMKDIAAEEEEEAFTILDVGGAMKPLSFATHVIDMLSFDERRLDMYPPYGLEVAEDISFSEETWVQMDFCNTPWPYADDEFNVVWCTHTIEDVRDPIGVIREMSRVGQTGFLLTIHRDFESLKNIEHPNYAGWMHHRWLIEPWGDRLQFTLKYPQLHVDPQYTPAMTGRKEIGLWWMGSLEAFEYLPRSDQEIHHFLYDYAEETRRKDAAGEAM